MRFLFTIHLPFLNHRRLNRRLLRRPRLTVVVLSSCSNILCQAEKRYRQARHCLIRGSFPMGSLKILRAQRPTRTLPLVGNLFVPGVGFTTKFHNVFAWLSPG